MGYIGVITHLLNLTNLLLTFWDIQVLDGEEFSSLPMFLFLGDLPMICESLSFRDGDYSGAHGPPKTTPIQTTPTRS